MYYLLTKTQYNQIAESLSHSPAWSLDNGRCIAHVDNGIEIPEYEQVFDDKNAVDIWKYMPSEVGNWELTDEQNFFNL